MRPRVRVLSTAGAVVVSCVAVAAVAACSPGEVSDPAAATPRTTGSSSAQQSGSTDALGELAASASDGAAGLPTLLLIVNETGDDVVLTSADAQHTATLDPGGSVRLASPRTCDWLPLTASTTGGWVIEEYTQPCQGQTWTITGP